MWWQLTIIVFIHFHIVLLYTEVICPRLTVENGDVDYNTSFVLSYASRLLGFVIGYPVNTLATFDCHIGYYREGSRSAICQTSGYWSPQAPICTAASNENEPLYFMSVTFF